MSLPETVYKQTLRALQDYDAAKKRFELAKAGFDSLNLLKSPFFVVLPGRLEAAKKEYDEARIAFEFIGV